MRGRALAPDAGTCSTTQDRGRKVGLQRANECDQALHTAGRRTDNDNVATVDRVRRAASIIGSAVEFMTRAAIYGERRDATRNEWRT